MITDRDDSEKAANYINDTVPVSVPYIHTLIVLT